MRERGIRGRNGAKDGCVRIWAVLTHDLAKAGPFITGSHQDLLPVMCWKMGSNTVICFMHPALLQRQLLKRTHRGTNCGRPQNCTCACKGKCIHRQIQIDYISACPFLKALDNMLFPMYCVKTVHRKAHVLQNT